MPNPAPFKVAAIQAAPVYMDLQGTVKKTVKLIEEAAKGGAKLVNFAETWIPGYPLWAWVGPVANSMMSVIPYNENSLEIDSDEFRTICAAARKNNIFVCFGFSERHRGTLYIAQALIDNQGEIVFTRRKLKATHVERTIFGSGDGSDILVAETELGNIGALACWEHLQPLTKYAMYSENEQIHCSAWPFLHMYKGIAYSLGIEANMAASAVYALEGQCFVSASDMVITQEIMDAVCLTEDQKALMQLGGGCSRIYGPDGSQISEDLPHDEEGIVYAEIDLNMIHIARAAADPAGHYARPDVTQLLIDRTKRTPVVERPLSQVHAVTETLNAADDDQSGA